MDFASHAVLIVALVLSILASVVANRTGTTLEIDSGCNDPMAIFLTVVFVTAVQSGSESIGASVFVYMEDGQDFRVGGASSAPGSESYEAQLYGSRPQRSASYALLFQISGVFRGRRSVPGKLSRC